MYLLCLKTNMEEGMYVCLHNHGVTVSILIGSCEFCICLFCKCPSLYVSLFFTELYVAVMSTLMLQCLILYCHKLLPNLDNGRKVCSAFFLSL